ncbi:DNA replication factor Cdt1-like [Acyrthosiphon pisum]|uniref:CDT1 Geminin-binding domain-containing protein n=2 Tax=Acyrthosiphon pisum TaxID=7029 RepID=A0A8R2NNN2_ACYPI|nr:DNA replication factor Cdt1-like [Acyrthosiphon pisum]|eukprot:XP_016663750.1 PREDICTED: DNA replication factor Cdt1-like [Acyrthosiphon pisum]
METEQKTLDNFIKNRKRPVNDHDLCKNELLNNTVEINKLGIKLSFDDSVLQSIKKQKVENGVKLKHKLHVSNADTNNILEEKEKKYGVNPEKIITPEQSPSTKAQLRQMLDLGEFHKIVCCKRSITKLQEKLNLVEQCQKDVKSTESEVETTKYNCLPMSESDDFKISISPVKHSQQKPLFPSPRRVMMDLQPKLTKILLNDDPNRSKSVMTISPLKQYSALTDSNTLPLPLKFRILNELFKVMETVLSMRFSRKEKITFYKLKQNIQQITKKNFTVLHLAQIKTIVPDFFQFSLVKSSKDNFSIDLVIAPVYGLAHKDNIDLIQLMIRRKNTFYNALIDIMKVHHAEYLNQLIPPILIDKDKITRWHPEFDVESVPNINPSPLPKIEIDKSKISTAKDILDQTHALFIYNNCLNRAATAIMNENHKHLIDVKLPTEDAKNTIRSALIGIPKLFLSKIQSKQIEKARGLMMRSVSQLNKDKMIIRLPDIARRIRTYFVQLQRNVMPLKKVIDQLKQSYPEAMTDNDWETHINLLQEKVPHWAVLKIVDGTEYIRVDKKINFEECVIKKLKNNFLL